MARALDKHPRERRKLRLLSNRGVWRSVCSSFAMRLFRPAALFILTAFALRAAAGCVAPSSSDPDDSSDGEPGDGSGGEDEISEYQLRGNELPEKTLALTFDDGPGPRTAELADYLAAQGIRAAFFINGKKVPGRQSALDAVVGRGHLLANHTQNHVRLTKLSSASVVAEVTQTDAFIAQLEPQGPWLLRPPFGAWNGAVASAVNATPMRKYVGSVFWDVGGVLTDTAAADWACWGKQISVARCADLYMSEMRTRKRGIVLMHDIHGPTVDMVKLIIPKLKAAGWSFASVLDVPSIKRTLASNTPGPEGSCSSATLGRRVPSMTCVQSRGDTKWHRCENGEWLGAEGPSDPKCTAEKFPLP